MTLLWIVIIIVLVTALLIFGLTKVYQNPKTSHQNTPEQLGIHFEEISIPTKNKRKLYAWWIPSDKKNTSPKGTLILVHGWGRNLERTVPYIQALHPSGYNLLAFDSRNHGSSDDDGHSSMIKFAEDIIACLDYIITEKKVTDDLLGIIGLSIGGASAIYAAALDNRIQKVITVGAFAHPAEMMMYEFKKRHIPYFPIVWLLFQYIQLRIGKRFDQIAPENNIGKASARFLLIHGDQDAVVPVSHAERLKRAAPGNKVALWVLPGKGHSNCHEYPNFWKKIIQFLNESQFSDCN